MAFPSGYLLALVVVVCAKFVTGERTQKAYALCTRDSSYSTLTIDFRLNLNSDPVGALLAYPSQTGNCPILPITTGTATTGHKLSVTINLTGQPQGARVCGFIYDNFPEAAASVCLSVATAAASVCLSVATALKPSVPAYTIKLMYYGLPDRLDVDGGINALYSIKCDTSNTNDLVAFAEVAVNAPNLNQQVTPYPLDVKLYVLRETDPFSGIFERAEAGDMVPVGWRLKLQLVYIYGTYDPNKYSHVGGLRAVVAPTDEFINPNTLLGGLGCPSSSTRFPPEHGFTLAASTIGSSVRETGAFVAVKYDFYQFLHFRAEYFLCLGPVDTDQRCNFPCGTFGRKRRETGDDTDMVTASIRVVDRDADAQADADGRDSDDDDDTVMYAAIGACIGIGAILCVVLCVALIVFRGRRRRTSENKTPPHVFANEAKIPY